MMQLLVSLAGASAFGWWQESWLAGGFMMCLLTLWKGWEKEL